MLKEPGVDYQVKSAIGIILTDRPVAYHPVLAKCFGSVTTALYLSQLLYWTPRADPAGWFWKTEADFTEETGLTRSNQETARAALMAVGVLDSELRGIPAKLYYRVHLDTLEERLRDFADKFAGIPQTGVQDSRNQESGIPAIIPSETTAETTTENTTTQSHRALMRSENGKPVGPLELIQLPEAITQLRQIPSWVDDPSKDAKLVSWWHSKGTDDDRALAVALALQGWWGDGTRRDLKGRDPRATFQGWLMDKKKASGVAAFRSNGIYQPITGKEQFAKDGSYGP